MLRIPGGAWNQNKPDYSQIKNHWAFTQWFFNFLKQTSTRTKLRCKQEASDLSGPDRVVRLLRLFEVQQQL